MIDLLIRRYPYFKPLYEDVYRLCENMEDIMSYYSEALQEMDKNTVQYMIEEQQDRIEEQQAEIEKKQDKIEEQQKAIEDIEAERERDKAEFKAELNQKEIELIAKDARIAELEEQQKVVEDLEVNTEREKNRADAAEKKAQEIGLSNIKNLMRNLGFTAEQAMQALNISEADRQVFRAQL